MLFGAKLLSLSIIIEIMKYLKLLLILSILTLSACNKRAAIPPKVMAQIYSDMFVLDQLIDSEPYFRAQADTAFVYEALLAKYGYTMDDYVSSVKHNLHDPERFAKIMKNAKTILEKREKELRKSREEELEEVDQEVEANDEPIEITDIETKPSSDRRRKLDLKKIEVEESADTTSPILVPWVTREKIITQEDLEELEKRFNK